MVTSIAPRAWSPVVFFHHSQYSSINCTLRPSICISCIFVALHLQNKSSGIRTYIVLCCRMNDCPGINNFVKITVKYMARPICIGCWGSVAGETSLPLACALDPLGIGSGSGVSIPSLSNELSDDDSENPYKLSTSSSESWFSSTIATSSSSVNIFFLDIVVNWWVETITERRTTRNTTHNHRLGENVRQGGSSLHSHHHSLHTRRHIWRPCLHNYSLLLFNGW